MRIYGFIKELAGLWFKKNGYDVKVSPHANTYAGTTEFTLPPRTTGTSELVGLSETQTLTGKTIDADSNTITNIEDADIKTSAAISRSKLASGTADHVLVNDGSGVASSEATLSKSRGGAGADMSSVTFPSSGTLTTREAVETLSGAKTFSDHVSVSVGKAVRFYETAGGNYIGLRSNAVTADFTFVLPDGDGTTNQVLKTDGSGNLGWSTAAVSPAEGAVYSNGAALQTTGAFSGNGNKIVGINSGATAQEYKALTTGTSGTDFNISHSVGSVALNIPDAGSSARGLVTTSSQTLAGIKTGYFSSQANIRSSEGAGTTTLTASDSRHQVFNISASRTCQLPTTGILAGEVIILENISLSELAVSSSDGTTMTFANAASGSMGYPRIYRGRLELVATQNAPTAPGHWRVSRVIDFGQFSSTLTFDNSANTTGSLTFSWSREDRNILLHIPPAVATSNTSDIYLGSGSFDIPEVIRPANTVYSVCTPIEVVGTAQATPGLAIVVSGGQLRIYKNPTSAAFGTAGAGTGVAARTTISWMYGI